LRGKRRGASIRFWITGKGGTIRISEGTLKRGHQKAHAEAWTPNASSPRLDFQLLNNQLVLSWTNAGFNLQSAPALTGPFTNLPAATSPYTNSLTAPQQFFRLISN